MRHSNALSDVNLTVNAMIQQFLKYLSQVKDLVIGISETQPLYSGNLSLITPALDRARLVF